MHAGEDRLRPDRTVVRNHDRHPRGAGASVVGQGSPSLTGFIRSGLGVSGATAGLVVASFTFGRMFGAYAGGVVADNIGERRVLVAGGLGTGALIALASVAPLPGLIALLVAAGVASAASTPAGGRLVLVAFPPNRRGLALGSRQTGIPVGGLVAAAILPWVAHRSDWQPSLAVAGAFAAAGAVPLAISARRRRWRAGRRPL